MKQSGEILMLGDINIDTVWPVNELPQPGRDAYVQSVSIGLGGAVLNTAIVLDRLGQRTAMLSCLGKDLFAVQVRELLGQTHINLSYIKNSLDYGTGLIFLTVTPDGERTMFSYRGANTYFGPEDLPEKAFETASVLNISGYSLLVSPQREAVWRAVELAKQHQVAISLDTGLEPALIDPDGLRRLLNDVDVCIAGPKETEQLFHITDPQKAAEHLLSLGVKLAAIKLGEKGCYMASRQGECFCPAFEIESVDTTGAGDSFTAGLLFGWLRDWDLQTCALLGSALGALATTVHGAGLGLAGKDALLKFLNDRLDTQGWQGEIERLIGLLE